MRKEYGHRVRKAMEYQKKAVMALLPESMEGHLELIGGEIRKMMLELAIEALRDCRDSDLCKEFFGCSGIKAEMGEPEKNAEEPRVKKVSIL